MGSITSWTRLEPQSNDPQMGSLAARVTDPLWLLARQWQFGEWQGEDAGSPVEVRLGYETSLITRFQAGPSSAGTVGVAPADRPWEAMVEAEPAGTTIDRRLATAAGQRFLDALGTVLASRYQAKLIGRYAVAALSAEEMIEADDRSRRVVDVLAARALDGQALHDELAMGAAAGQLPAAWGVAPNDESDVLKAARRWLSWWDSRFPSTPGSAWQSDQLDYQFAVAAPTMAGEVVLSAPDHTGGRIDWTSFDLSIDGSLGAAGDATVVETRLSVLPTGLGFPGMPPRRWWQFENGNLDFGGLEAAPEDLGRLLLAEFALIYGNDFFCVPVTLPVGSVCRVTQLEVKTNFGETVTVPNAVTADGPTGPRWRMFEFGTGTATANDDGGAGWLVVPANAVHIQSGAAIEDVLFSRDEMSDLGWAVERRITGPAGSVVERREAYHRGQAMPTPPSGTPTLTYELAGSVPPYWLPLIPAAAAPGQVQLELRGPHQPLGRLLTAGVGSTGFALLSAELPRSGRVGTRHHRRSRWIDGTTALWTGRRIRSGRGESSAGLTFDTVVKEHPTV